MTQFLFGITGEFQYRPLYRPAYAQALPCGIHFDYVELPRGDYDLASRRPDIPMSRHPFGIIATDRALTADELRTFELEAA